MKSRFLAAVAAVAVAFAGPVHADESVGNAIDDATITANVKAALLDDKSTHSMAIHVETYKGIVQLRGFVTAPAEKDEATRVAKTVKGVREVRNNIVVHGGTSVGTSIDDTVLTSKIKSALLDTADVKSTAISVETKGGMVQLGGFVGSEAQKERAAKVVAGVKGVTGVDNAIIVKPD